MAEAEPALEGEIGELDCGPCIEKAGFYAAATGPENAAAARVLEGEDEEVLARSFANYGLFVVEMEQLPACLQHLERFGDKGQYWLVHLPAFDAIISPGLSLYTTQKWPVDPKQKYFHFAQSFAKPGRAVYQSVNSFLRDVAPVRAWIVVNVHPTLQLVRVPYLR